MKKDFKAIFGIFAVTLAIAATLLPLGCGGSSTPPNTVDMHNLKYAPATLTVSVGTTVTWRNTDNVQHSVTSTTGLFDSGLFSPGGSYTHTFTTAGTYPYYCIIHPGMTGTIIVQ
ncbi:cupredoxin domain-containing protein [Dehalogenimonas etheniformans]|uniref:Amidase n=1 Tax=Dehalogenimonas etheniformans TaxID=1536648 RepID=A0A2P5P6D5_9CHLR|nr:cupredoxin family copper-binding protein [Dehalogenimonas etheniformans]PPD57862.1 amidase [Dehalogenimonas etheniformans]QNT75485.1 cupredoxin family copper-binding protein [Dehalogenimonas etheniformans]